MFKLLVFHGILVPIIASVGSTAEKTNITTAEKINLEISSKVQENDPEINRIEFTEENSTSEMTGSNISDQANLISKAVTEILNDIQKDYDRRVRPYYGGEPVDVAITMFILSISSVSEVDMDFTFSFYFRQMWRDPRLKFKGPPGVDEFFLGAEYLKLLWQPDTFFTNEKKSFFHIATTSNELLRITSKGDVLRSTRLTVTASCPMNLRYFPMDRQLCKIDIESYRYSLADIRYLWAKGKDSVGIAPDVSLAQFRVLGHRQKQIEVSIFSGNYSRISLEIQFVRSMGYYLIQIYIPSGLIVIISWLSFWLSRNATTARVALGVTTVLTMATLMSSVNATLPKISYVKAMDVYLATCFLIVFASLLENATVGYLKKRIQMRKAVHLALKRNFEEQKRLLDRIEYIDADDDNYDLNEISKNNGETQDSLEIGKLRNLEIPGLDNVVLCQSEIDIDKVNGITPVDIDKCSRILFPVTFIVFNIMYWMIYLSISDVVANDLILFGSQQY